MAIAKKQDLAVVAFADVLEPPPAHQLSQGIHDEVGFVARIEWRYLVHDSIGDGAQDRALAPDSNF